MNRIADLIGKHWQGKFPLLTSFLGFGIICVALGIGALRLLSVGVAQFDLSLATWSWVELARYAGCTAILAWAAVGIWRSAAHYSMQQKWIARIILGACAGLLMPIGVSSAKTANELVHLGLNEDPLGPPAAIGFSGSVISLTGPLSEGTADRFVAILNAHPNARRVNLSSIGGRLAEAQAIADEIKKRKLDTFVVDECNSACTDVLLAGVRRAAAVDARIGFHQATMDGYGPLYDKLMSEPGRDRLLSAGIDPKFVERAFATGSSDLWVPSNGELRSAGVLTTANPANGT